jgi:hypothetical protein
MAQTQILEQAMLRKSLIVVGAFLAMVIGDEILRPAIRPWVLAVDRWFVSDGLSRPGGVAMVLRGVIAVVLLGAPLIVALLLWPKEKRPT